MADSKIINRREFMGSAAAASLAITVVPRQVLGGPGYIAPSDKITLGYIGCGNDRAHLKSCIADNCSMRS
jgi:hypothetical protein